MPLVPTEPGLVPDRADHPEHGCCRSRPVEGTRRMPRHLLDRGVSSAAAGAPR